VQLTTEYRRELRKEGIRTTISQNRLHESSDRFGKFDSYFEEDDFKDQRQTMTSQVRPKFRLFVVNTAVIDWLFVTLKRYIATADLRDNGSSEPEHSRRT